MNLEINETGATKAEKDLIFESEFLPHAEALHNFAFHLTYSDEDANDLVQETFMKSYRFIDSYEQGTNAKAWLFKILKNGFINDYRKKVKEPNKVDYEEIVTYHDQEDTRHVGTVDMRHEIFQNMLNDEVSQAINKLPVDFRTVILLCDIEGFSYEEIAKIINIPIGTVRSRLHRSRHMMKEYLKDYAKQLGFS